MNTRVGTLNWLPPETFADHAVYTAKSDVFSFGMVYNCSPTSHTGI
jgi:serine/threonine protein kinase